MAISLTGSGLTVGGTATNIVTAFSSILVGTGTISRSISCPNRGVYVYTCPDPGIGGIIAEGNLCTPSYDSVQRGISLPSGGIYFSTYKTVSGTTNPGNQTLTLSTQSSLTSGGTFYNAGNTAYVGIYLLAVRVV